MALSLKTSSESGESWFYPRASLNDLRSVVFWRDVVAETLAVTVLMIFVILVVIGNNAHYVLTTTHLGFFAIVAVYLLIEGYGPISGTHLNPAGSLSLFLAGKISFARATAYIIAQIAGTAAGSGLGYIMTPEGKRNSFPTFDPEHNGLTVAQGVLIEGFLTFNLIFVALSCHDTVNRSPPAVMPSLPIACCIGIGLIAAGTHTGGLMNPLIALGPSLLAQKFTNQWVYWVGPLIGGPLAVIVYKLFIFIKLKFGPKPAVVSVVSSHPEERIALSPALRDELIALLEKIKESKCSSV